MPTPSLHSFGAGGNPASRPTRPGVRVFICALALAALAFGCAASESNYRVQSTYSAVMRAELRHQPYPVASTIFSEWPIEEAYETQALFVKAKLRKDRIGGFKAGLTAKPAWEKFGLDEPLAGVLPASGALTAAAAVSSAEFRALKIETEIAFVVGKKISAPLAGVADLTRHIAAVAPAIELPDLSFRDVGSLTGKDVIAANATAAAYMLGATVAIDAVDLATVATRLERDGTVVGKGKGSDAMGDPWQAALWLVNKIVSLGYEIEPGHVLLSGALPTPFAGLPGNYRADFGALGTIDFVVR